MKPSPDLGTPCSGQSVNWNCRTVRDWPSCGRGARRENAIKRRPPRGIDCQGNILLFLSNDCCHLILDQWPRPAWSWNVSVSVIVSRSEGNYIFASLHSLSVSLLMEINSASVGVASGQA